jgi:SAM-dependent methyltransferase
MPERLSLTFISRIARHRHVLWVENAPQALPKVPQHDAARVKRLAVSSFNQRFAPLKYGRFYPAQTLRRSNEAATPVFRVTGIEGDAFLADFNPPLANRQVAIEREAAVVDPVPVGKAEMLLIGPGIEAPLAERDTDFGDDDAFQREDQGDDARFYEKPRMVSHIDATCASRITALYAALLPPGAVVLDLMASHDSHLPGHVGRTIGVGMNETELSQNPQLESFQVIDLNREARLPFPDGHFDAVVNTVSIEYLIHPLEVLREVRRVLRPQGLLAVSFSNRFFPPKAIRLWVRLHPLERLGWVLQLLHDAGFRALETHAERGLRRAANDRYAADMPEMDPVLAAWGRHC